MEAALYQPIYLYSLLIISLGYALILQGQNVGFLYYKTNNILILFYIILFVFVVGLRPLSYVFVDTMNYAGSYKAFQAGTAIYDPNSKEWVFEWMMYHCSQIMDVHSFFLIIEIFYVFPVLWACYKFAPNHYLLMFIFCMGAFSFFTYGVNGIRNGMACSLIIAALACVHGNIKEKIIGALLCFAAFNIHRSTALPILCILGSFFVKDSRYIMGFWLFSIIVSLVAGGSVEQFFISLGFDDRMEGYSSENIDTGSFSSIGFRRDFLLYSCIPIILGYYVLFVRKIWDKNYLLLLNTYILCNSFWVMMIRASFSNRFAYLSWFMYALVLAYPCLKLPVWKNQGSVAALILLAHFAFTFIMFEIVYL